LLELEISVLWEFELGSGSCEPVGLSAHDIMAAAAAAIAICFNCFVILPFITSNHLASVNLLLIFELLFPTFITLLNP
jgi:hypothetical protein